MTVAQRIRHVLTWPLRTFFDRRFDELESGLSSEIVATRETLVQLIDERVGALFAPLESASQELRSQVAATSETLTHVGVELRRLTDAIERAGIELAEPPPSAPADDG